MCSPVPVSYTHLDVYKRQEPAGGIHVAHLFVEVQVNFLVDDFQGAAHRHGRPIGLQHLLEAGEYPHAGADGTPMPVRSALKIINEEIDLYFNEQDVYKRQE